MTRRLALVLTASSRYLYQLGRSVIAVTAAPDEPVSALLGRHLRSGDALCLYCDFLEESYLRTELPLLWSAATRNNLLARRLVQQFPDTQLRGAIVAPSRPLAPARMATLVGVTESDAVQEVLDAARALDVRLVGLWPLSLALARYGAREREWQRQEFLLSAVTPAGLRHVLVRGGQAVFSRLSPRGEGAQQWLADVQRTAQYLSVQRYLAPGALLPCRLWWPLAEASGVELPDSSAFEWHLEDAPPDVYGAVLRKEPPAQGQLLPPTITLPWRAARAGQIALRLGAGALVGSLIYAVGTEFQTRGVRTDMGRDRHLVERATTETAAILATARGDLAQADLAQAAVQVWTRLVQGQPDALASLRALADVMGPFPDVRLQRIRWEAGPMILPAGTTPEAAAALLACPADASAPAAAAPAPAPEPAAGTAAAPPPDPSSQIRLDLTGQMAPHLSLRERVQEQQRFEATLRERGWQVSARRNAVDLAPESSHAGMVGEPMRAQFELCLKPPPRR